MTDQEQPRESDLELVVSLSGDDVAAINAALLQHVTSSWLPALVVVTSAHHSLLATLPSVPQAFWLSRDPCGIDLIMPLPAPAKGCVASA